MISVPHPIAERAADLLAGLSYPGRLPHQVGAFGAPRDFPRITIEQAIDVAPWPGRQNDYTNTGNLRDPLRAYVGQNFYTGMALGHDLVRAFLLGLLCELPSSEAKRRRMYTTACQLADGDLQKMQGQINALQTAVSSSTSTSSTTVISAALPRAIIDTAGAPGDVVRWNGAKHLEVATGEFIEDQETVVGILGAAVTAGQETEYYPPGSKTPPIAGLVLGRVYRHRDGSAKPSSALIVNDWSIHVGVANGDGRIDVQISGNDFQVPVPPND